MFKFQGAFALCRVVKKNQLKTKTLKNKNEQAVGSGCSSLATSPCRDGTMQFQSFSPSSSTTYKSSSMWISPDFILDSSKVHAYIYTKIALYIKIVVWWYGFVIFKYRIILKFRRLLLSTFPTFIFQSMQPTITWDFARVLLIWTLIRTLTNQCKLVTGQIMNTTKRVHSVTQTFSR